MKVYKFGGASVRHAEGVRNLLNIVRDEAELFVIVSAMGKTTNALERVFTAMQKAEKARRLLHCFFRFAVYQNWCAENIIKRIWISRSPERTVPVLTLEEVYRLLACAAQPQHRCCAAAVGLMLWCGIRPFGDPVALEGCGSR